VKNKDMLARFETKPKTTVQLINTITPVKSKEMAERFNNNTSYKSVVRSVTKRVVNKVMPISNREMRERFGIETNSRMVEAIATYLGSKCVSGQKEMANQKAKAAF